MNNNVDNTKQTIISFCSGIRGIEGGIKRALGESPRIAAYVEIEAFLIENLLAGMEAGILDEAPIWSNLKTFPSENFHGKIHGIIGGYPCQPFSNAGYRKGESDPRHLWPYIKKHIQAIQPIWCFFENVPGHLSLGYNTVRRELQEIGYTVKEGIYSAEEVGASHLRKRLYIMAYRNSYATVSKSRSIQSQTKEIKGEKQRENREWMRSESSASSENVGNIDSQGLSIPIQGEFESFSKAEGTFQGSEHSGAITETSWPAGQGYYQHPWEAPREIESGLGITINGYNFREDLLRAAGNGIVEQTCEIAYLDLLKKHGIIQ